MDRLLPLEISWRFILKDTLSLVLLSVLFVVIAIWWFMKEGKKNFPPGPYCLPLVGYLPFLGKEAFKTLDALGKKYGTVYSIKFGPTNVVIITDYESFKEAFSKTELLDRPPGFLDFIPGGGGFSGANGRPWIEQRRFSLKVVRNLGLGKGPWESIIIDEVQEFVNLLRAYKGDLTKVGDMLSSSVSRNIVSLLISKPIEPGCQTSQLINEFIDASLRCITQGLFYSHFPGLFKWLVKLNVAGLKKDWKVMERFTNFISEEVEERKEDTTYHDSGDFIGSYLEEIQRKEDTEEVEHTFKETNLLGNIMTLVIGGIETTKTSLQWLLVAMVQHPEIQQKVYLELETVLGEQQVAQWKDRARVPLTYACIMEGQRWKTLSPVNVLRQTIEDTQIRGYDVPKGTAVAAVLWSFHNDTKYWKDPEKFDPTRFLKSDGSLNLKPESYAPFSYGKRNCPGETFALMEILIYFSAIVRNFEIQSGNPNEEFLVEERIGVTHQPIERRLRFLPRNK